MRLRAFAVFDVKSDSYSAPFWKSTVGQALRDFADLANNKDTTVGRHPEDFKLVQVGEFEDSSGVLFPCEPVSLGFATDHTVKAEVVNLAGKKAVS